MHEYIKTSLLNRRFYLNEGFLTKGIAKPEQSTKRKRKEVVKWIFSRKKRCWQLHYECKLGSLEPFSLSTVLRSALYLICILMEALLQIFFCNWLAPNACIYYLFEAQLSIPIRLIGLFFTKSVFSLGYPVSISFVEELHLAVPGAC